MADLKTKPTDLSVKAFLSGIEDPVHREDCLAISEMMRKVSGEEPVMWGDSIVGFGSYHYRYASGREGDWFRCGFSPRKGKISLYIMSGFSAHAALLARLGKFKTGKSCLYIKKLADVDRDALTELLRRSVRQLQKSCG